MANAMLQSMALGRGIGQDIQQQGRSRQFRNALASGNMQQAFALDPAMASRVTNAQTAAGQLGFQQEKAAMEQQQQAMEQQSFELFTAARTLQTLPDPLATKYYEKIRPQLAQVGIIQGNEERSIKEVKEMARLMEAQVAPMALGGMSADIQKEYFKLEDEDEGGPVIYLQSPDGSVRGFRRDSKEVDQRLSQGWTKAPGPVQRVEQGDPGAFAGGKTEIRNLRDKEAAARNLVNTVGETVQLIQENPDINTLTSRAASFINDLQQEVKAVTRNLGIKFDENILDPSNYKDTFDNLGIQSERLQGLITSLAFQAAAASGQTGKSVSDKDVERFIKQTGLQSSDPRAIAQVLHDLASRTVKGYQEDYRVRTSQDFQGDLGLSELPTFEARQESEPQGSEIEIDAETQRLLEKYGNGNR